MRHTLEICRKNKNGADDEARTRYLHLGKVALYQMSYIRTYWCLRSELNQRHEDFQSSALPTELQRQIKKWRPGTGSNRRPLAWQASVLTNWTTGPFGGNNRARTCDPLLVRQMLSQLSYAPTLTVQTYRTHRALHLQRILIYTIKYDLSILFFKIF